DQGGGVVIGGAVFSNGGNQRISGRFYTEKYYAIVPSGFYCSSTSYDSLGSYQRYHPLMKNVISFKGNYYTWYPFGYPYPDASIIAQWERGYLLVATKEITGVRRVDLGFLLYSSDADPDNGWLAHSDGAQLMANALLWVAQRKGLSEMTTFSTKKDTVLPQQTGTIEFTIDTDQAISNKTYRGYIVITSNTARGIDSLAVSLTVSSIPYYFTVDHDSLTQYGLVGKSVYYGFALHNLGASTDSYELQFKSNQWPVTSWDQNLTHKITNLNNIVAGSTVDFALEVAIPDSIFLGQVDSLWFSITSVNDPRRSRAYPIKTSTEWKERFRSANLDTTKWQKVRGNPYITSFSYHKTSPPYSLGIPGNSAIETKPLNFSRYSGRKISLKYYYQNSGIEKGEDLIIQCYTGSYWMELKRLSGREEAKTQFLPDSIQLSEAYFNAGLKIKFETEFGSGGTWYLDDIEIVDGTQIPKPDQPSCDNDSNQGLVYDLQPNFPNPFNPITQITYSLPEPGHVQIKIYNVLGQLVVSLVDKVQREGKYQIVWDASGCSAGLYFCTIRVNWYSRSNKMLLLK
ncbi:MAG: T9SS type A sorting domain-containing protein, partial [candidate division KSB1 bacterium]|nr:T9SS type A sorting domain-containing protein [candidate division KSB1 bacterium]